MQIYIFATSKKGICEHLCKHTDVHSDDGIHDHYVHKQIFTEVCMICHCNYTLLRREVIVIVHTHLYVQIIFIQHTFLSK